MPECVSFSKDDMLVQIMLTDEKADAIFAAARAGGLNPNDLQTMVAEGVPKEMAQVVLSKVNDALRQIHVAESSVQFGVVTGTKYVNRQNQQLFFKTEHNKGDRSIY